ncbi:MAG: hypothetical protein ACREO1_10155 [Arenimonas sp.]
MKKTFAFSLLCLGAISACQPETAQEPVQAETPPAAQVEPTPAPVAAPPVVALVRSEPISTEGAANFTDNCNLEGVDGILFTGEQITVSKATPHVITGWLINPQEKSVGTDLKLVIAGVGATTDVWASQLVNRVERAGVAETRAYSADLINSGFSFEVKLGELLNGEYHVYVMMANAGGVAICDPGRQIKVID